jgi:uncharacterized membrane protein YjgN (DUF898 family)
MSGESPVPQVPESHPFRFDGTASAYFGIWVVNILLTILTLGIYSAWAKVRRLRYFYGNTSVMGHAFEYHANPLAILKGRLIVVAVLIAYNVLLTLYPVYGFALGAGLLLLVPFAFMLSYRFNARVTSWRNVRFFFDYRWKRDFFPAIGVLALMPVVAWATAFMLAPVASRMRWQLVFNRLHYGRQPMREAIPLGPIYGAFLLAVLIGSAGIAALIAGVAPIFVRMLRSGDPNKGMTIDTITGSGWLIVLLAVALFCLVTAYAVYSARIRNLVINHAEIDGVGHATSRLRARRLAVILLTNTLAILCTLGLATPWAATRLWRYRVETMAFTPRGDLDEVLDRNIEAGTAVGAEWADFEGIDLGF